MAITFLVYGTVYEILFFFPWVVLVIGPWTPMKFAFAAAYTVMELVEVLGLVVPLVDWGFRYEDHEHGRPPGGQNDPAEQSGRPPRPAADADDEPPQGGGVRHHHQEDPAEDEP